MPDYMNITCDPVAPRTIRDFTAHGILNALSSGGWVNGHDVDLAIVAAGGNVTSKSWARKALGNLGYAIVVEGRNPANWRLAATAAEMEGYRRLVVKETFSRHITIYRSIGVMAKAMPGDLMLQDCWGHAITLAISLGTDPAVGFSVHEVINAMDALVP